MRNLPVNKTGYLKGAKTAKNPVNVIPSNLITTQGMAFPIKANGKTLYPNTGQYKFNTPYVVETPLKQKGTKNAKVEKEGPVMSWIKDRIIDRVKPTTYDMLPRIGEFIAGEKYNARKKITPERGDDDFKTGLAADQDILALSLGRKPRNNAVVRQTLNKPISDKSKNKEYYSIPSLNKDIVVKNYLEGKERMAKLNKEYPGKIEYNFFEKGLDYIPNDYARIIPSYKNKKDLEEYRKKGVIYQTDEGMYNNNDSFGPMGNFGTWEGKDEKGRYISYKDKIDYEGNLLGKAIKPILDQKDVNIYDRIYIDKKGNPIVDEELRKDASRERGKKKQGSKDMKPLIKYQQGVLSISAKNKKQFQDVAKIKDNEPSLSFLDYPQKQALRLIGGNGKENYSDIINRKKNTPGNYINSINKKYPSFINTISSIGNVTTDPLNFIGGRVVKGTHSLYNSAKTLAKTPRLVQKAKTIKNLAYGLTAGNIGRDISAAAEGFKKGSKSVSLAFSRGEKDPKGGLTQKGVDKYNRATGGNLKMAVTTPPSKLKPGSKAANRRKSFCARMSGVKGPMMKNGKPTRKALALRKWNC